jgi:hypothetical protein
MPLTEQQLATQATQLEQLKNELFNLNGTYEKQIKALGITEEDLRKLDPEKSPPEVKKLLEKARQLAKREGERRALEAKTQLNTSSSAGTTKGPSSSRRRQGLRP